MAINTLIFIALSSVVCSCAFLFPKDKPIFFPKDKEVSHNHDSSSDTVILLHVLFRHGHRTRDADTYPNDPYANETFYPFGLGQLTNEGKRREYDIGKYLRKKYGKFLGEYYNPDVLDARSTDVNRTKMSLELVLASLYPPVGEQVWLPGLNWQPIPYNYWKAEEDFILGDTANNCPYYRRQLMEYITSEGLEVYKDDLELYKYLSENTGWNITNPFGPYGLFFVLSTEEEWGLKLPAWTEKVWPTEVTEAGSKVFILYTGTNTLKKYSGGFLLKKIIDDTHAKINGALIPETRKIFLYSAHERNVGIMLRTLGIYDKLHVPPYGSFILFEVHRNKETYGIKIYYQDYRKSEPQLIKIPGCSEFCELKKFESIFKNILPESDSICKQMNDKLPESVSICKKH